MIRNGEFISSGLQFDDLRYNYHDHHFLLMLAHGYRRMLGFLQITPKLRMFLWLYLHNVYPVLATLVRGGIVDEFLYFISQFQLETLEYFFIWCYYTRVV